MQLFVISACSCQASMTLLDFKLYHIKLKKKKEKPVDPRRQLFFLFLQLVHCHFTNPAYSVTNHIRSVCAITKKKML